MQKNNFKEQYGPWSLVTGASSGIGEEFARQLAALGLDVVIAARREEKLSQLAKELENKYSIKVKVCVVDLSVPNCLATVKAITDRLDIGLLVSNAGTSFPGKFLDNDLDAEVTNLILQTQTPLRLIKEYGQPMRQRGRGGIILLSSSMAYMAGPLMANYVACKAFTLSLAESLWYELKDDGVDVLSLAPGPTKTEGTAQYKKIVDGVEKEPPFPMDSVENVVKTGLEALGKKPSVIAGTSNKIMSFIFSRILPRASRNTLLGKMMGKATQ
jgi:short-subunit dehydrogenase